MAHVLMTGGGTLGPVTPLLAVAAAWRKQDHSVRLSWIGTPSGPEKELIESAKISFKSLSVPKFDRHRKWKLPFVPLHFIYSCLKAKRLLDELKPDLVMSAGAYVSVPIVWMARLKGIPVWIHQLDVVPGLANKLMARAATKISVTWEESASAFPSKKTQVLGAMARKFIGVGDKSLALERYAFNRYLPTVLVIGGGTGAASINELMGVIGSDIVKQANVLHLTGNGKMLDDLNSLGTNYVALEFLGDGLADAYALADVVVARAGMGTIAELAALGKAAILIPMPDSHQVNNAKALHDRQAAVVLELLTPQTLLQAIENLLKYPDKRAELEKNIRMIFPLNAEDRIVVEARQLIS